MEPNAATTSPKPGQFASLIRKKNPLRILVSALLLGSWYFGLYQPKETAIGAIERTIRVESKRLEIAREIGDVRGKLDRHLNRIPKLKDANEYYQSILDGVRRFPLTLVTFTPEKPREQGPFTVLSIRIEMEGPYASLDQFLRWVETNDKLMRVDMLRVEQHRKQKELVAIQLQILGLTNMSTEG